jgi:YidC/Oxa1 family membrane protein insertase
MTDIRRTVLWVVFSASLFLIWNAWSVHNGQPSFFSPGARPTAAAVPAPGAGSAPSLVPSGTVGAAGLPVAVAPAASAPSIADEQVTISTDLIKARFATRGGEIDRLEFLKQVDQFDRSHNEVLFDETPERLYVAQTGLVPAAGGSGLPNHHTVMHLLPGPRTLAPGSDSLTLAFESPEVGGVKLVKTYTFHRDSYAIDVKHQVINDSGASIDPRLYFQLVRDGNAPPGGSSFYSTFTGPAVYTDGSKFKKVDFKSIEKREPGEKPPYPETADNGWIAVVQHYFASAWLIDPPGGGKLPREYFTGKDDVINPATGGKAHVYSVGMLVPLGAIAPGQSKTFDATLFAGPQEENKISALAPGLELVKDYGVFKILAEPLFWLLTQLHKFLGNWGWSIVGLVVLLKIAFFWLNATAYKSMAKMKAINPRIMEMRERLKDKPQQMQQEMMRIYREEKVNPLGGCLPIVAQMPFFISLYWVLLSSVEMRNAPWIGWITDLSVRDPYFILPLLMTATSLLQTWLNPTPPDPVQAKMMWIMPLVFSVMFFFFPAGLVLYWLTNNILSIAQQYLINKKLGVLNK